LAINSCKSKVEGLAESLVERRTYSISCCLQLELISLAYLECIQTTRWEGQFLV